MKCPFCQGTDIVKSGLRKKKYETIQLFYCNHCQKKFTPLIVKGKTYPLKVILDAITFYNRFYSLEESAKKVNEKYGFNLSLQNISSWLNDFSEYLPFLRMREFIAKKYDPRDILVESKMFHGQIYDFKYHRAKTDIILQEDFKHYKFRPLQEFLELVIAECPHSVFKETEQRASEYKNIFNLDKVKITPRDNFAVKNTRLVMQAVANNKLRHEVLQEFMLVNDSVTVATEVPVLLDEDDLRHYQNELGFEVPLGTNRTSKTNRTNDEVITGHIDLLQIRNGAIHILDYKPSAKKEKPVDQLTLYALALARLTGLRLFHFKCAWFDKDNYFEFFPLHVVYPVRKRKISNGVYKKKRRKK
ncbi:MAG: PD-(D/E)XK nuclease family protein [Candidatus Cloacimonetes bacterium]|nr:PD-(D/E)XK nuclease family protein [Candidatus Cloacimonadota bacterium]